MVLVASCVIWFHFDCIMQLKKSYYIATNVYSRKSATTLVISLTDEGVVAAAPTGNAPTTSEIETILLPNDMRSCIRGLPVTLSVCWCRSKNIPGKFGQYHGCWCCNCGYCLVISNYDIGCVGYMNPWGRISNVCGILMLRDDRNCKNILMFVKMASLIHTMGHV